MIVPHVIGSEEERRPIDHSIKRLDDAFGFDGRLVIQDLLGELRIHYQTAVAASRHYKVETGNAATCPMDFWKSLYQEVIYKCVRRFEENSETVPSGKTTNSQRRSIYSLYTTGKMHWCPGEKGIYKKSQGISPGSN